MMRRPEKTRCTRHRVPGTPDLMSAYLTRPDLPDLFLSSRTCSDHPTNSRYHADQRGLRLMVHHQSHRPTNSWNGNSLQRIQARNKHRPDDGGHPGNRDDRIPGRQSVRDFLQHQANHLLVPPQASSRQQQDSVGNKQQSTITRARRLSRPLLLGWDRYR